MNLITYFEYNIYNIYEETRDNIAALRMWLDYIVCPPTAQRGSQAKYYNGQ